MIVDVKGCLVIALALSIGLSGNPAYTANYRASDVAQAIKDLGNRDQDIRHSAAFHLSEMGPEAKDAVPQLTEVVQSDPIMTIRGEAASALGKIGAPASPAVPALIEFLKSKEGGYERTYAASALGGIGKQPELAVPALTDALDHDGEPVVKRLAAMALGDFGAEARSAIPSLIRALDGGDKEFREAAAYGLRKIPAGSSDVPALEKLLGDDIDIAREAAARSIAGAGSEAVGAVPKLVALLEDKNASVREAAAKALGAIGPDAKEAVPALKKALSDAEVHNDAADALEQIKKRRH